MPEGAPKTAKLGWKSTQKWDTSKNSKILRKNLGEEAVAGKEAHHIVQSTAKRQQVQQARDILDKYQIDINAAENGVPLAPGDHRGVGLHSHRTQNKVLDRLRAAERGAKTWEQGRMRVVEALGKMADEIKAGTFVPAQ